METGSITNINILVKAFNNNKNISINKIQIGDTDENTLTKQEIDMLKELLNTNYGIEYVEIKINSI